MAMYFIEAFDTLFFRDGRPFEIGGYANLQIPPSPSNFYGAIRSALITSELNGFQKFATGEDEEFTKIVGEKGDSEGTTAKLQIKGPLFARLFQDAIESYFPLPRDLLIYTRDEKKTTEQIRRFLVQTERKQLMEVIQTNCDQKTFLMNPYAKSLAYEEDILLNNKVFARYLSGDISFPHEISADGDVFQVDRIFSSDFREGIAMKEKQKNVETSRLFTMQHLAFESDPKMPYGFVVEIENNSIGIGETSYLRLGGDGKVAQMRLVQANSFDIEKIKKQIDATKMFKIYLATPALFQFSWKSKAMYNKYFDDYTGLEFELITASVGRAEMYGGYDIVTNVPKVSFPAVPAGSVYYFKLNKGTADDVINAFHQKCISDYRSNQGFGYSFVGGITNV